MTLCSMRVTQTYAVVVGSVSLVNRIGEGHSALVLPHFPHNLYGQHLRVRGSSERQEGGMPMRRRRSPTYSRVPTICLTAITLPPLPPATPETLNPALTPSH